MMQKTIICKNCNKEKPANIRLKGTQQYCGATECQRARKAAWQRQTKASDAAYRNRQQQCVQRWQRNKPNHRYMDQYRGDHPKYVENNRQQQTIRNQKRRLELQQQKIVKMDALVKQLEKSTIYVMTPYQLDASKKIVKMDALLVELTVFQENRQPLLSNFA